MLRVGLGWTASRGRGHRGAPSLATRLVVRELREQAVRRYLPMVGIVAMAIALVFTLSRGGLVNLVAALLALLAMLRAVGRLRRSLVVTGVLLVVVLAYGGWIGFEPVLARLSIAPEGTAYRLGQYVASLPLLREFPVLGVGLGPTVTSTSATSRSRISPSSCTSPTPTTICSSSPSSWDRSGRCSPVPGLASIIPTSSTCTYWRGGCPWMVVPPERWWGNA